MLNIEYDITIYMFHQIMILFQYNLFNKSYKIIKKKCLYTISCFCGDLKLVLHEAY